MDGGEPSRWGCPPTRNIDSEVSTLLYNLARIQNAGLDQARTVKKHVDLEDEFVQKLQRLCGMAAKISEGLSYLAGDGSYPASVPSSYTAKFDP